MTEESKVVDVTDLPTAQHLALRIREGWKIAGVTRVAGGMQFKLKKVMPPHPVPTPQSKSTEGATPEKPTARLSKLRPRKGGE